MIDNLTKPFGSVRSGQVTSFLGSGVTLCFLGDYSMVVYFISWFMSGSVCVVDPLIFFETA